MTCWISFNWLKVLHNWHCLLNIGVNEGITQLQYTDKRFQTRW
jgi:hypothetical protein